MARPTSIPTWATAADRTLEPSAGEKSTGWEIAKMPPARKMNWLFNLIYQWLSYIDPWMYFPVCNWIGCTNPKNFGINKVAFNGTYWIAVGQADGVDAYILKSYDCRVWEEQANPKNFNLRSVCWNGTVWVAVGAADGTNSYIVTSPDGEAWTERSPTVARNVGLFEVGINDLGYLVAVGEYVAATGCAYILSSANNGVTWTERTPTVPVDRDLYSVACNGPTGEWVAVGETGYILWSEDMITWTAKTPAGPPSTFYAVIFDLRLSLWVAAGTNIYTSTSGQTWTSRTNPPMNRGGIITALSICSGVEYLVIVGIGDSLGGALLTSQNGTTWACRDDIFPREFLQMYSIATNAVDGLGSKYFIVAGASNGSTMACMSRSAILPTA